MKIKEINKPAHPFKSDNTSGQDRNRIKFILIFVIAFIIIITLYLTSFNKKSINKDSTKVNETNNSNFIQSNNESNQIDSVKKPIIIDTTSSIDSKQLQREDQNENNINKVISKIVEEWNTANSQHDLIKLNNLYADEIKYYGTLMKSSKAIQDKERFFIKYPDFIQTITGSLNLGKIIGKDGEATYIIKFTKKVNYQNQIKDYPSYLYIKKIEPEWKIMVESDDITDHNLNKKAK